MARRASGTRIRPQVTRVLPSDTGGPEHPADPAPPTPLTPDEVLEVVRRVFPGAELVAVLPRRGTPEP
jgi:hypothetical protein